MKKVEVLVRSLPHGKSIYGKGGIYTVSDAFAAENEALGKLKILEDLGSDGLETAGFVDHAFLAKVKHHLPQIMSIIESEFRKQEEARRAELEDKLNEKGLSLKKPVEENEHAEPANEPATGEQSGQSGSESTDPSDTSGSLRNNGNDSNIEQTDDIPDGFPGKKQLIEKEIKTMSDLKTKGFDELVKLGIAPRTATQIGAALAGEEEK